MTRDGMREQMRLASYRAVVALAPEGNILSREIAERSGVNPTQVRRDLARIGKIGVKGTGYQSDTLIRCLDEVIQWDAVRAEAQFRRDMLDSILDGGGPH